MKVRGLIQVLHLKSIFKWLPVKREGTYLLVATCFMISQVLQAVFFANNVLSNIPLWLCKCYLVLDGARTTLMEVLNMWFYYFLLQVLYTNLFDKEQFISSNLWVKYNVILLNLYSAINVSSLLFCIYEGHVTYFGNKMVTYLRYFGQYDRIVGLFLRQLLPLS